MNTATKCLFGGALVAAGLATHEAHAQEFVFIDTTASAYVQYGAPDSFSGPGPWDVHSAGSQWVWNGFARTFSTPTCMETSISGLGLYRELSVDSHFTVTSNTFATLSYSIYINDNYTDGYLEFTDLTTGTVLLSVNDNAGSQVFELLAKHEYRFSLSMASWGSTSFFINPPECPADMNNDGTLNYFDVSAFITALADNDPIADFNNDNSWNFIDVTQFLLTFSAGCPYCFIPY